MPFFATVVAATVALLTRLLAVARLVAFFPTVEAPTVAGAISSIVATARAATASTAAWALERPVAHTVTREAAHWTLALEA